jgi:RNA polymerase sigma-70 factor (ECF subfamily)
MADLSHQIEAEIPRLRRYALALTRNVIAADDLVQNCLVRALTKQHLWQEGTDLRAWLLTILHHQYVNDVRRGKRQGTAVSMSATMANYEPSLSRAADQEKSVELRDLDRALAKLPEEQRTVILMVGLEDALRESRRDRRRADRHRPLAPIARPRNFTSFDDRRRQAHREARPPITGGGDRRSVVRRLLPRQMPTERYRTQAVRKG